MLFLVLLVGLASLSQQAAVAQGGGNSSSCSWVAGSPSSTAVVIPATPFIEGTFLAVKDPNYNYVKGSHQIVLVKQGGPYQPIPSAATLTKVKSQYHAMEGNLATGEIYNVKAEFKTFFNLGGPNHTHSSAYSLVTVK